MADGWLLWSAGVLGVGLLVLLTLAGFAFMSVFLAAVVWLAARRAVKPHARADVDDSLRRACDRLPICDCRCAHPDP